jgi:hypothetical protein
MGAKVQGKEERGEQALVVRKPYDVSLFLTAHNFSTPYYTNNPVYKIAMFFFILYRTRRTTAQSGSTDDGDSDDGDTDVKLDGVCLTARLNAATY